MLKEITVAECELCGRIEKAKAENDYRNGVFYAVPDGWQMTDNGFCICKECWKKLCGNEQSNRR